MTLPELCERSDSLVESMMPNTTTATSTDAANPLKNGLAVAAATNHHILNDDEATIATTSTSSCNNKYDNNNKEVDEKCDDTAKKMATTTTTTTMMMVTEKNDDLDDLDNANDNANSNAKKRDVGDALKTVLKRAASEGRVTCSLGASVDLLSSHPDDVMLCVLPLPSPQNDDASATIQSTLLRAVCLEHGIRVLSVDCDVKLAKAVAAAGGGRSSCRQEEEERAAAARKIALMMMMNGEEEDSDYDDEDDDEYDDDDEEEWDYNCNRVFKTPAACSEDVVGASSSSSSTSSSTESVFTSSDDDCGDSAAASPSVMGFPCVLVRYPTVPSQDDELVAEFCKERLFGFCQEAYIELPD